MTDFNDDISIESPKNRKSARTVRVSRREGSASLPVAPPAALAAATWRPWWPGGKNQRQRSIHVLFPFFFPPITTYNNYDKPG